MNHKPIPTGIELRARRMWQRIREWLLRDDPAIDDGLILFLILGCVLYVFF